MRKLSKRSKILIVIFAVILVLITAMGIYRNQQIKLLDRSEYKALYKELEEYSEKFRNQEDLQYYIVGWADENNLDYTVDKNKNIIFHKDAVTRKSKLTPTTVVVNYNYENANSNRKVLAAAAMCAKANYETGDTTVIFVNNERNDGAAYESLSSYISDKTKVIYLDYGKKGYISSSSFAQQDEHISIDAKREALSCDTAIRIKIGGIPSDVIDAGASNHTNPIDLFSTVLTRLKSKSTICQLADFNVDDHGYMYPTDIEATVMINSYAVESFIGYLDKRIEAFQKKFDPDDYPDAYYQYEILEPDNKDYPTDAYTKETFNSLVTVLYAVKNGTYRFDEDDDIPEGYEESSIYGINSVRYINNGNNKIIIDIVSQALDIEAMEKLEADNSAAAELASCEISQDDDYKAFNNDAEGLIRTLQRTYFIVNRDYSSDASLHQMNDTYFTPMTFIHQLNPNADIVHIKMSSKISPIITNTLLCYIKTKGNLF